MSFTAQDVANLRQKTGAGMMECKNALKEASGNFERAREILRQKGLTAANKKADKIALEGIVISNISNDKKTGSIAEINSQTDFVAKNESFQELARTIINAIVANKPKSINELLSLKEKNTPIQELISTNIATTGENIQVRRFETFELGSNSGIIGTYIHPVGNKIGVLVKLHTKQETPTCIVELEQLAKDIAMHIAACQPQAEYIDKNQIPKEVIESEKRIELGKEDLAKKPKEIAEKIVQGRLDKILSQRCLLDQPYIKDPSVTIEKLIQDKSKKLNIDVQITKFVRYNVGEAAEENLSLGTQAYKETSTITS